MVDPLSRDEEDVVGEARALLERNQPSEAAQLLRMHLQRHAGTAAEYMLLGVALSKSGEGQMALETFEQAVALEPGNAIAHYNLGQVYQEFGRDREALGEWERALELRPDYPAAARAVAAARQRLAAVANAASAEPSTPLLPASILADEIMRRERQKAPRGMIAILIILVIGLIGLLAEPYLSGSAFLVIFVLEGTVVLPLVAWTVYWLQMQALRRQEEEALRRGDRFGAAEARVNRRLFDFLSRWL